MSRWYMPLFRQYLEWSVLNTGVILRERCRGKKIWSGIRLKLERAKQLAYLGRPVTTETRHTDPASSDISEPENSPQKARMSRNVVHVPGQLLKRKACCVHCQGKTTKKSVTLVTSPSVRHIVGNVTTQRKIICLMIKTVVGA